MAHRQLIVDFAEKVRLPALYAYREYVEIGGLMAYAMVDFLIGSIVPS